MTPSLQAAVANLYSSFERAEPPTAISGCPCCATPEQLSALVSSPLRVLRPETLDFFARKAITTVGEADDLRYFLPRLIELSLGDALLTERPILYGKLSVGDWRSWPPPEVESVELFTEALAASFGRMSLEADVLDEWVCALGQYVEDLGPCLDPLLAPEVPAANNLVRFWEWNRGDLKRGKLWSAFWEPDAPAYSFLLNWFRSPEVLAAIDRAYVVRDEADESPPSRTAG